MKASEVMSAEGINFMNQNDASDGQFAVKISEMPSYIAELVFTVLEGIGVANDLVRFHGVEMFVHGWFKLIPREWSAAKSRLEHRKDPEYNEYLRLKEKFELSGRQSVSSGSYLDSLSKIKYL